MSEVKSYFSIAGVAALSLIAVSSPASSSGEHVFRPVDGGALYLLRLGIETHRAEFDDAADCEFVAGVMNKAEPQVRWLCDTSAPSLDYECSISGIEIRNIDSGKSFKEDISFSLSLGRRSVARASFPMDDVIHGVASKFKYWIRAGHVELTNSYPYVNGNYISRSIYQVKIAYKGGVTTVMDINGRENGNGVCKFVER